MDQFPQRKNLFTKIVLFVWPFPTSSENFIQIFLIFLLINERQTNTSKNTIFLVEVTKMDDKSVISCNLWNQWFFAMKKEWNITSQGWTLLTTVSGCGGNWILTPNYTRRSQCLYLRLFSIICLQSTEIEIHLLSWNFHLRW